ncbi:hypothetical protein WA026_023689 [Henosepilachna vigintioctopunctata]|uniref:Platelet-derived growth factor (PDGF) family profile domain-containing protein n=1 Tax=Henosepilachna vigintioctopunctata TaxID=420089 RepID=A0AAW1TYA3_9CUCU
MISFSYVCSLFAIFLVVLAKNKEKDHHKGICDTVFFEKWEETLASTNNYQCGPSKPRSFTFSNLYRGNDEKKTPESIIQPWAVVLHRCKSAGCCAYGYHCAPATQKMITIVFKINERESRYVEVEAKNETSCSCQLDNEIH